MPKVSVEVAGGGDIYLQVGHGFDTQKGSLQLKLFEHHQNNCGGL